MSDNSDKSSPSGESVTKDPSATQDPPNNPNITETGSSVIIDMGQLGERSVRTDKPEPIVAPMMSNPNLDRITFSDLEAFVPKVEPQAVIEKPVVPAAYEPPVDDVVDVRPPSLNRFLLIVFVLLISGIVTYGGWRLDWDWTLLKNDPVLAINVIAGIQQKPAPPVVRPPPPPQPEQMRGELRVEKLAIINGSERKAKNTLIVRGEVNNATNRVQRAIMLRVSIMAITGSPLDSKRHICCQLMPQAQAFGGQKGGTDAPEKPQERVLKPGQSAIFEVAFDGRSEAPNDVKPKAEVTFFEAERVP